MFWHTMFIPNTMEVKEDPLEQQIQTRMAAVNGS